MGVAVSTMTVKTQPVQEALPVEAPPTTGGQATREALAVSGRLQAEFHLVEPDHVTRLVLEALDRTRAAPVQVFRAVLAERHVRDELRRRTDAPPSEH